MSCDESHFGIVMNTKTGVYNFVAKIEWKMFVVAYFPFSDNKSLAALYDHSKSKIIFGLLLGNRLGKNSWNQFKHLFCANVHCLNMSLFNQCISSLNLWVCILFMERCTWYNIMWLIDNCLMSSHQYFSYVLDYPQFGLHSII